MSNLKKLVSVLVVLAMMVTTMIPALAETSYSPTYGVEASTLKQVGLMVGDASGNMNLDQTLNREQGITLLLALFGLKADADALTDEEVNTILAPYTDASQISNWAKKPVAYAIKTGISYGVSATVWGPQVGLKGQMFAKLIANAAGHTDIAYGSATLSDLIALSEYATFTDADIFNGQVIRRDQAAGIMAAALFIGIEGSEDNVFVSLYRKWLAAAEAGDARAIANVAAAKLIAAAYGVTLPTLEKLDIQLAQTGAAKFEINFGIAVEGVSIQVKRGLAIVNTKSIAMSEDKKVMTVTMANNIASADYTVVVNGLDLEKNEFVLHGSASTISSIALLGNMGITADAVEGGAAGSAVQKFSVYNQYEEAITAGGTFDVFVAGSNGKSVVTGPTEGIYTITTPFAYGSIIKKDASISLTIVHSSGVTLSTSTVVTAKPVFVSLEIGTPVELATLREGEKQIDTDLDGDYKFYIPVSTKDQFGNDIKVSADDLNKAYVAFPFAGANYKPFFVQITKDDTTTFNAIVIGNDKATAVYDAALADGTAGTYNMSIIQLTANSTPINLPALTIGKKAKIVDVEINASNLPEIIAAGDAITVPYTAVDQDGNVAESLTNAQLLAYEAAGNELGACITIDNNKLVLDTKTEGIKFNLSTSSQGIHTFQYTVVAAREATTIQSIADQKVLEGKTITLSGDKAKNEIVFLDQYGAVYNKDLNDAVALDITPIDDKLTVAGDVITVAKAGTYTVTAKITGKADSSKTFTVVGVAKTDITSIIIEGADVVNGSGNYGSAGKAAYQKSYTVKGKTADGTIVDIHDDMVTSIYAAATAKTEEIFETDTISANLVTKAVVDATDSDVNAIIVATVNTGAAVLTTTKTVKLSIAAPYNATVSIAKIDAVTMDGDSFKADIATFNGKAVWGAKAPVYIKVVDQYGVENYAGAPDVLTISYVADAGNEIGFDLAGNYVVKGTIKSFTITAVWADGSIKQFKVVKA